VKLLSGPGWATALFTADGLMTAGALDAIRSLNIRIPDDVSMVGFDDLDWMRFLQPAITAVAQPLTAIGEAAARMMLKALGDGKHPQHHIVLQPSLMMRDSIAGPKARPRTFNASPAPARR